MPTDRGSEVPINNRILLLVSKGISYIGTKLFSFALSWYILAQTGSGLSFSISLVVNYLPAIMVSLFAGWLSDKIRRPNWLLVLCDVASACVCIIPLVWLNLSAIYCTIFLLSCISALFNNVLDTHLPNLEGIGGANGLKRLASSTQFITSGVNILAPSIGGVLINIFSVRIFVWVNVVSFLASAFGEIFLKYCVKENPQKKEKPEEKRGSTLLWLFGHKGFRPFLLGDALTNFCVTAGISVAVPFLVTNVLGISSSGYGLITSCLGVGSVVSALYQTKYPCKTSLQYPYGKVGNIGAVMLLICLVTLLPGHPIGSVAALCALEFAVGWLSVAINVKTITTFQLYVDDSVRGKVLGTLTAVSYILIPLSLILAGMATEFWPAYVLPAVSGGLLLVSLGGVWLMDEMGKAADRRR